MLKKGYLSVMFSAQFSGCCGQILNAPSSSGGARLFLADDGMMCLFLELGVGGG